MLQISTLKVSASGAQQQPTNRRRTNQLELDKGMPRVGQPAGWLKPRRNEYNKIKMTKLKIECKERRELHGNAALRCVPHAMPLLQSDDNLLEGDALFHRRYISVSTIFGLSREHKSTVKMINLHRYGLIKS